MRPILRCAEKIVPLDTRQIPGERFPAGTLGGYPEPGQSWLATADEPTQ